VVLVGPRIAREAPQLVTALRGLEGMIDEARMRALNRLVDEERRSPKAAAEEFLTRSSATGQ
jgi:glycine betaine/choline ABC-type transport system substrate-binding protein